MDDPRTILAEAGVECPEVEAWASLEWWWHENNLSHEDVGDAAILALARLVAHWKDAARMRHEDAECYERERDKYKWQRDEAADDLAEHESLWRNADASPPFKMVEPEEIIADLDRRWEES